MSVLPDLLGQVGPKSDIRKRCLPVLPDLSSEVCSKGYIRKGWKDVELKLDPSGVEREV